MNRKIVLSLGIIAALVLYLVFSGKESDHLPELTWQEHPDTVTITSQERTMRLHAKDGSWFINEEAYPADKNTVDNMLKKLEELDIDSLVSNKGYPEKYDLTPEKCIKVEIAQDKEPFLTVCFGKKSSTNRHTYITVNNKPEIYMASGVFDSLLDKTVEQMRDKTIMKVSREAVSYFEVMHNGKKFVFEKKQQEPEKPEDDAGQDKKQGQDKKKTEQWTCRGYEKVVLDTNKVNQLLSNFDPLRASAFPDMQAQTLGRARTAVKIKAFGKDMDLKIYTKNKDDKYIATASESPYVFTIDEWKAKKFFITGLDALKK